MPLVRRTYARGLSQPPAQETSIAAARQSKYRERRGAFLCVRLTIGRVLHIAGNEAVGRIGNLVSADMGASISVSWRVAAGMVRTGATRAGSTNSTRPVLGGSRRYLGPARGEGGHGACHGGSGHSGGCGLDLDKPQTCEGDDGYDRKLVLAGLRPLHT